MKRILSILITLAMLLSISGCGIGSLSSGNAVLPTASPTQPSQVSMPTQPKPEEITVPTEPAQTDPIVPTYHIPLTAIVMPQIRETESSDTGGSVFTYAYPNVTFLHQDMEVARTVLPDLRNRIEAYRAEAESLKAQAGSILAATGAAPDHAMTLTCDPARVDQSILSVLLVQDIRSDAAQGIASIQSVTYDLASGEPLTLTQLLADDATSDLLQSMLLDTLFRTEGLYSWYELIVSDMFSGNTLPENWYLSEEGLCFYFIPYEIAPYSHGTVTAVIPYEQLGGVIRDRYYPPEIPDPNGNLIVSPFEGADLSIFSSFAEVLLDDADTAYLLFPTDVVTQLRICDVVYEEATNSYLPTGTVFATDILTSGQAVRLQYMFAGLLSTLQIRYVSGGEPHTRYLRLSGEDGSVYLSE